MFFSAAPAYPVVARPPRGIAVETTRLFSCFAFKRADLQVHPEWNANEDARVLRKAMKGLGTGASRQGVGRLALTHLCR
jgi:hypothetical protein